MKTCPNCGAQLDDSSVFCPACGAGLNVATEPVNPPAQAPAFDPEDVSENKVVAMVAYLLGIFGIFIALLCVNNSKYVAFHVKQALKILVCEALLIIIAIGVPFLGWLAAAVGFIICTVLDVIGFFFVCMGKSNELPIIRKFRFLK